MLCDFVFVFFSMEFQGSEQLPRGQNMEAEICQRELFWIDTLDALQNKGLNEEFDMSVILEFTMFLFLF